MSTETAELDKAYDPTDVEPKWYRYWSERGVFDATDSVTDTRPVYVLPMPPPNVTGSLHMGHAMFTTIEDVLTRTHRMRGFNTLWLPGIDHAGIATQTVVERQLKREGKTRHDLGREKFLERVWAWKAESGGRITEQQRVLGTSADWRRTKFTMDPDLCVAVRHAFVQLYKEGLIYRDTRLIHWDCEARTVLSNLEVENEPANGELYEFAYLIEATDGGGEIVVATTRPETMLGDTAIAVHPDDPRYKHLHGKRVKHPFVERSIPIITDAVLVDMAFGTGAVKITPAHDFNDFATGKRHKLEEISIFNIDGTLNAEGGQFKGLDRFEARKAVKRALEEKGLARGSKPHQLMLPKSERSGTVVEPMISTQWFVKTAPLAAPALEAVRSGKTKIIPEEWTKTYEHWMTNILDWCISRQLWWGHRIPAFFCDCGHITVTDSETCASCEKCNAPNPKQDEDVLDTWFSSALWPFSTVGWPEKTPALAKFYPASDLETGYDILFFWVARMMMMGCHFMGEPPFKRILLHGLVVDETGDKMSKVKGNVIDPLDLIHGAGFETVVAKALPGAPMEEALKKFKKAYPSVVQMGAGFPAFGADALRFALASYSPQSKRIALSPKKIEGTRNFCNKIWNATRFALPYIEGAEVANTSPPATLLANRWILSRLRKAGLAAAQGIDDFRLDDAANALYHFFWGELCDWFLELSKPILSEPESAQARETRNVLAYCLEASLRALHPIIPFITEELWQKLPRPADAPHSIAIAKAPDASTGQDDPQAESHMHLLQQVISAARTVRSEHEIKPGAYVDIILRTNDAATQQILKAELLSLKTLMRTNGAPGVEPVGGPRPKGFVATIAADIEILISLKGHVEGAKEAARIDREVKKAEKDIGVLEKKLSQPSFADKAPPEVVAESKALLETLKRKRDHLEGAKSIVAELDA